MRKPLSIEDLAQQGRIMRQRMIYLSSQKPQMVEWSEPGGPNKWLDDFCKP
jgi:hypothetical protein